MNHQMRLVPETVTKRIFHISGEKARRHSPNWLEKWKKRDTSSFPNILVLTVPLASWSCLCRLPTDFFSFRAESMIISGMRCVEFQQIYFCRDPKRCRTKVVITRVVGDSAKSTPRYRYLLLVCSLRCALSIEVDIRNIGFISLSIVTSTRPGRKSTCSHWNKSNSTWHCTYYTIINLRGRILTWNCCWQWNDWAQKNSHQTYN